MFELGGGLKGSRVHGPLVWEGQNDEDRERKEEMTKKISERSKGIEKKVEYLIK